MSSNQKYDTDSRPRRMIFDAKERCMEWVEVCQNAHMGLGQVNPGPAERALHNAVMSYWLVLAEYRNEPQLDGWAEDPIVEDETFTVGDVEIETLDDCRALPFGVEIVDKLERDPVEGTTKHAEEVPAYLSMAQSVEVFLSLNDAAHELGFMADPKIREAEAPVV